MSTTVQPTILSRLADLWKRWVTPRSSGTEQPFHERTIRGMIPILLTIDILFGIILVQRGAFGRTPALALLFAGNFAAVFGAMLAVIRLRITLAGFLLFLYPVVSTVGTLMLYGYWTTSGIILYYITIMFGAVVLPRKFVVTLPLGMIASYAIIAYAQHESGMVSPAPSYYSFAGPAGSTAMVAILTLMFSGIGSYMLNEFERQRNELETMVELLEDRVAERTRHLEIAANVSKAASTERELHKLLDHLVEGTRQGFNLCSVSLFLLDDEKKTLWCEASTRHQLPDVKTHVPLTDNGPIAEAARTRMDVIINDTSKQPNNQSLYRAQMCVPLIVGNELVGVMDLQSEIPSRFANDDLGTLISLSEQFGVAIQNARLNEHQLKTAEQLRAVDQMKSQFLASVSHELRTPLNAILNFTEIVAMGMLGPVNEKQTDVLNKAVLSSKHLLALINDVLDITKMESGAMKLFVEADVNIYTELETVSATAQTLLQGKPVVFVQDIDQNIPILTGDKRRIRQILLNLIANAAKFTERGTITLSVKNRRTDILFAVIDTGPGIALEDQELIFDPFVQSEAGLQHAGGTGLGLPISRRLTEAHGGRLWVESQKGDGAAFFVSLPVQSSLVPILKPSINAGEVFNV